MAREDEKIGEALRRIFGAYRDFIETALVQAEQKGSIPTWDNSKRAGYILALLEGAMLFAKLDNNPQFFRGVIDSVMAVAES
jgi:TetR/AcrR family transcriptional repressor of nem operon